jgi:hypothetical protein
MTTQFTKTHTAQPIGEYTRTVTDSRKDTVMIRLLQCSPKIVDSKVPLKGRGIKQLSVAGRYQVSDTAWTKLQSSYSWTTDF